VSGNIAPSHFPLMVSGFRPSRNTNGDTVRDHTIHFEGIVPEGGSDIAVECCL